MRPRRKIEATRDTWMPLCDAMRRVIEEAAKQYEANADTRRPETKEAAK